MDKRVIGCVIDCEPCGKQHLREIATPDLVSQLYASQTKILENETAYWACVFEILCEGVSTFLDYCQSQSTSKTHALHAVPVSKSSFGMHKCTNLAYYLVWFMVVKSLPNPTWLFLASVVSHMDCEPPTSRPPIRHGNRLPCTPVVRHGRTLPSWSVRDWLPEIAAV